jgi:3-dehydroquinate synthase
VKGKRTVWLVGMMGAGKSTVGPALARRLNLPFVDLDAEIERANGRGIPEIFEAQGEQAFRALEAEALERVAGSERVVALGGGALTQYGVSERVAAAGTVVYLRAAPQTLLERIGDPAGRPLLAGLEPREILERLSELLTEREPAYTRAAVTVDTDRSSVGELVEQIVARLGVASCGARLRSAE